MSIVLFILSNFWHWLGAVVLLAVFMNGVRLAIREAVKPFTKPKVSKCPE